MPIARWISLNWSGKNEEKHQNTIIIIITFHGIYIYTNICAIGHKLHEVDHYVIDCVGTWATQYKYRYTFIYIITMNELMVAIFFLSIFLSLAQKQNSNIEYWMDRSECAVMAFVNATMTECRFSNGLFVWFFNNMKPCLWWWCLLLLIVCGEAQ